MSTRMLQTTLPSDTLYVSGTVNGVSTTWTNTAGQTWETVAERSSRDVYNVELTVVNSLGTSAQVAFTLYYGLQLVTDRTKADVDRAKTLAAKITKGSATAEELAEWNSAALKGAYNHTDLNRVGAAMQYVADRLNEYGCAVSVAPKRDWVESDIPTSAQMAHYLADVTKLRGAITLAQDVPPVPGTMARLTHAEANDIERILESVDLMLTLAAQAWVYSGEVYCGEV